VFALDEARLTDITCHGFRVTQVGLPPSTEFELVVLDPVAGTVLRESDVRTDAKGRLDTRVRISLRGLARVDIEVEKDGDEYAETGAELHLPCSPKAPPPSPVAAGPRVAETPDSDNHATELVIAGLAGVAAAVTAYVIVTRLRRSDDPVERRGR
jgi:hypothetical protein